MISRNLVIGDIHIKTPNIPDIDFLLHKIIMKYLIIIPHYCPS